MVPCDVLVPRAKATFVSPNGGVAELGATVTATVTAATTLASPTLSSAHLTARFMPSSKPRSPAGLEGDRPVEDDGRYGTGTRGGELVPAPGRAVEGSGPSSDLEGALTRGQVAAGIGDDGRPHHRARGIRGIHARDGRELKAGNGKMELLCPRTGEGR